MEYKISKSKEMMQNLLSQAWEVEPPILDENGKIIIPRREELIDCLGNIEKLFSKISDIFYGRNKDSEKEQLSSIKIGIEWIQESIETAYLMPSRQFLVEKLQNALDIIEMQDKELDDDAKYYKGICDRITKRFGEDVADEVYWGLGENDEDEDEDEED